MKKILIFSIVLFTFISFQLSGQTWSSLKRLSWTSDESMYPSIATVSTSVIHVVWQDETPGNDEIFYKKSTDEGATWSSRKTLTWNTGDSKYPVIAADSSNAIHVAWHDYTPGIPEIFYKCSTDGGATWLGLKRLTYNAGHSFKPNIAADSGSGIHVVWYDNTPGNNEIFYKRSTDSGATWTGLKRLTWNSGKSNTPSIAADSGTGIHIVWYDDTPGNKETFYKRSTDNGATWSGNTRLTWDTRKSNQPSITVDPGNRIHVVWFDDTPGNREIYYKRSTNGGTTWSVQRRMTWNAGDSYSPAIAADSGTNIHIVWYDDTPGNFEIFYKHSADSGANWSGLHRVTYNSGLSYQPSIATGSGNRVDFVWQDTTPGNKEIYYKNRK